MDVPMIFAPLVDLSGFRLTPPEPVVISPTAINCRRTCPGCNDRDGEVIWFGDRTCPWCRQPIGVPK